MLKPRKYLTDLTTKQWQLIQIYFVKPSNRGRKRTYSRRDVVDAIFYLNRAGCQWRMLPNDFIPWRTVYQIFYRLRKKGVWEKVHHALRKKIRKTAGKNGKPTAGIIDSQTVKTTEVGGDKRGYDAGKKVNGRKGTLSWTRSAWSWQWSSTVQKCKINRERCLSLKNYESLWGNSPCCSAILRMVGTVCRARSKRNLDGLFKRFYARLV